MSRRRLLGLSGGGILASSAMVGCDLFDTTPAGENGADPRRGQEAPSVAELVESGVLPPLEDRLPAQPMVVEPVTEAGRYGGTLRNALVGTNTQPHVYTLAAYENLVRWVPDWTGAAGTQELVPNIAESFEISPDGTAFTFRLREGMRWSDGEPFTADDVVFAVDDVLLNEEIFPVPSTLLTVDGEPARIDKHGDYEFTITFPAPRGLFLQRLATYDGHYLTHFPRHYLQRFHAAYNDEVDELVEADGVADWVQLFGSKAGPGANFGQQPDLPSLAGWQLTRSFATGDQNVVLERNPYYWKVDSDGRQLPYLEEIVFAQVNDLELLLLKGLNGEIDLEVGPDTRFTTLANKPLLAAEREPHAFGFLDLEDTRMNVLIIHLNLTHPDPVKRAVFQDRDFRIGLSLAINRPEIIDAAMQGRGEPYQVAPLPGSPFYDEEMATQFLDYAVELANEYLDRAFPDTDAAGWRLGPDGEPITFAIDYVGDYRAEWTR